MIKIDIRKALYGSFGEMQLRVDLHIKKGEFLALMGESGSGKTTFLRILAGLESATGEIEVENIHWLQNEKSLPPQERKIGFVFQDYALFENMTVEQNLLYVNHDTTLAMQLLKMTELTALAKQNVQVLSGGQKQRVSLCRAMMRKPELLLMDEPLSALDPVMRAKLQQEIKQLHDTFGTTTIIVSHDPSEVYALADRVLVLEQGRIVKDNLVEEVLRGKTEGLHYETEVLQLSEISDTTIATVLVSGELLEVEVDEAVKIGDRIEVVLNPAYRGSGS